MDKQRIENLLKALAEIGITTQDDLTAAIKDLPALDITIFTSLQAAGRKAGK